MDHLIAFHDVAAVTDARPPRVAVPFWGRPGVRTGLIAFGWLNVGLGVIGMFLPVMPTTVFLLVALWAFSKSSKRLHDWLFSHPRFGPNLRAWQDHRVIPRRAKVLAVVMMAGSFVYVAVFSDLAWPFVAVVGILLAGIAGYILTRPSAIKAQLAEM